MNSAELAELLARTHRPQSSSASSTRNQHSANASAPATAPATALPASLSPRQIFQSRVRTLSDDGSKSTSYTSRRPRNELQRLSTLRVHVTSPGSGGVTAPPKQHTDDSRFGYSPYEHDFITEERAVWNTTSPTRSVTQNTIVNILLDHDDASLRLSQGSRSPSVASESTAPLQVFGPSAQPVEHDERPKTSRGNRMPGAFPAHQSDPDISHQNTRKSKFFEGSMNERSVGVSSTWDVNGERLSEETSGADEDADSTPRDSRTSMDSFNSSDLSEFRPTSTTPATLKQRLSRLASSFKLNEDTTKRPEVIQAQPKRKGLRKSMSTWGFHSFGEKVKFFGASAGDPDAKKRGTEQVDGLNERKRKAEEAYAEQFGTKKQKNNDGIAAEDRNRTVRGPSRTLKKRSVSAQQTPTTRRRRNVPSSTTVMGQEDPAEVRETEDLDLRKRPSRRELEKENQQLRALLRERQARTRGNLQLSASRSSLHLPLEDHDVPVEPVTARVVTPKKAHPHSSKAGVPPVPPLPNKAVLATLGNKAPVHNATAAQPKAATSWKDTGTIKRVTRSSKLDPPTEVQNENLDPTQTQSAHKEEWQWPDDVF